MNKYRFWNEYKDSNEDHIVEASNLGDAMLVFLAKMGWYVEVIEQGNYCGLCGEELDENGFHEDGICSKFDEDDDLLIDFPV